MGNKYIEALNQIMCRDTDMTTEEAVGIIEEAISKAEKYDEAMKCNESFENDGMVRSGKTSYFLNILNTIESINHENKILRRDAIVYRQDIDNAYKTFDSLMADNERLKAKINTLVDGIKAMIGVTVFYDRGVVSVSGLGYGEDSDIRYDSIVKSFEIVEAKK